MPRMGLTPDKVVAAAGDLADRDGVEALSLSTLADTLGVRVPSLYKHIGGLDDLRRRVAVAGVSGLAATLHAAVDGKHGRDALIAFATAYRRYAGSHPGRYAAVHHEQPSVLEQVVVLLRDVIAGYGLDGDDAAHAVDAVRSALHGFVSLESRGAITDPAGAEASYFALVSLFDRALGAPAVPAPRRSAFRIPGWPSLPIPGR